ncbi:MAG: tetratricopeptide repeat protein [Planctomycetia bacterium]|nr:tetratricopeptide repeat protein [Planctomycetia bacterium]
MRRLAFAAAFALLFLARPAAADRGQAESAVQEGDRFLGARDFEKAIAAYTRAIDADPAWATAWGKRGYAKRIWTKFNASLEDFGKAIELEPQQTTWRLERAQAYLNLDRAQEAIEEGEALIRLSPNDPANTSLLGWALIRAGEVDRGLELQTKALDMSGGNAVLRIRADGLTLKGDWKALVEEMEKRQAGGQRDWGSYLNRVVGHTELGEYDKAAATIKELEGLSRGTTIYMARVYLLGTPGAGGHYDAAMALAEGELAAGNSTESGVLNIYARALFLTGHPDRCLDLLVTKGRRTNFQTLFWLGAAHWKLGQFAEARAVLQDARRLNPYILKHAEKIEGLRDFVASIDRDLAGEGGQQADRGRLGYELATHLMTVAEIEALVRRYRFQRAAEEYEKLLPSLKSAVRRAEVETRLPEVKGMAGAHAKLLAAVNKSQDKPKAKVGKSELTLVKADEGSFDFTIKGGEGRFPWAYLDPAIYCDLAVAQGLKPEETFGLGCLAWDAGLPPVAAKLFDETLKKQPALKKNLSAFVARKRGIPAPDSGFVSFRGSWVTPEEKANLEKGLVLWQGQWVPAKDRDQLAKGMVKIGDKWLPGEEAELLKRGFRKYKDKWMAREDYEAIRGGWEDAYTEQTEHYLIKSNETEQFTKDLAVLIEAAYAEFKAYYGGDEPKLPGKEKMTLYAYRTYEDYRKYCVETKAEDHLNAAGFARSDSNVVVGWNKTNNRQQFLQTMVHEAAHLYFFRVASGARPPSWYAEAMATYFEGFNWDGKTYRFTYVSESRLPFVRDAMKGGRHIALKDMLGGDALQLINSDSQKALLFYAQCWSLNYYLSQTENRPYREAYAQYRKAVASGGAKSLLEFFPDVARLEADWVRFVSGM